MPVLLLWIGPVKGQGLHLIASGGGTSIDADLSMTLQSTLGQAASGYAISPNVEHGAGFWFAHNPNGNNNVGTATEAPASQPGSFTLHQNYPNPFNPTTRITYAVPSNGFVSLAVYNVLGREVKNLVSEVKVEGTYGVTFDAGSLPSGIYFYTLKTEGQSTTRQMTLLR